MKRRISFALSLVALSGVFFLNDPAVLAGKGTLATITGSVKDEKGNPLAGAIVSLLKDGANVVIKETRTSNDGRFSAKIAPGRYSIRAIAKGFNAVAFASVEVRPSQELIYRFNLEPIGSGKTLPERRKDRDDVRWILRSAQTRRSIFQVQEADEAEIKAALGIEPAEEGNTTSVSDIAYESTSEVPSNNFKGRTLGVVQTYFAGGASEPGYPGLNFAISTPASEQVELIFAGQTGFGAQGPERLEATGRVRINDRHNLEVSFGGMQFNSPRGFADVESRPNGQVSVRAIDEWIVRDGIVIVMGLDYSRFIGAGSARSLSPRIGLQFDPNARTRIKAAYAPGGDEGETQSVASFEGTDVVFTNAGNRPIAVIDGQAVMERSHRLEFGVERVLSNDSSLEATAFLDTTSGRGVGFLRTPISGFSGTTGDSLINVANQQGGARGMRVVYTRRLGGRWSASAGYSFGEGQRLASTFSTPDEMFADSFFQTAALQVSGGFRSGTHVRTVLRFSPNATVFAIDPFAGRLGVYDPSLSIQVTQDLPSFGLPVRAEAVLDARNLLDAQASTENGEILTQITTNRRSVRGGISLRF
ncbi:MAG TPA: TonB-dependent receptor [Pyrinomonadaceae bacterium]|nr:TonB-dependent receptor [Pyrinomonadaceae bacterium]